MLEWVIPKVRKCCCYCFVGGVVVGVGIFVIFADKGIDVFVKV